MELSYEFNSEKKFKGVISYLEDIALEIKEGTYNVGVSLGEAFCSEWVVEVCADLQKRKMIFRGEYRGALKALLYDCRKRVEPSPITL